MDYNITHILMKKSDMPCMWHNSTLTPPDLVLHSGKQPDEWSPDVKRFNAVVEYTWDHNQNICRVYIQVLGEEQEPQEEQQPILGPEVPSLLEWLQGLQDDSADKAADEARRDSVG